MIAKMRGRQREFEPDPVPTVHSVREDLAMDRNHKMRRHMVVGVNCLVHAGRECSLTGSKTQAHGGSSFMPLTAGHCLTRQKHFAVRYNAFCPMEIKAAAGFINIVVTTAGEYVILRHKCDGAPPMSLPQMTHCRTVCALRRRPIHPAPIAPGLRL